MKRFRIRPAVALWAAAILQASGCGRTPEPSLVTPERRSLAENQAAILRKPDSWRSEEPIRLLSQYVQIDTQPEKGEERGALFLKGLLDCEGIETEIVCPAPKRCNLLARLPGRTREGALLLLNHIDVAPIYATDVWKPAAPFEGRIKDGYLYGRGSYDMKSIAIAQLLALRTLKRHGIVPRSDILFLAEADEEIGQKWGSRWLLEHRPEWFQGVSAVLNEGGTSEMVLRDVRLWGIETLQGGYAIAELKGPDPTALRRLAERWKKLESPTATPHPQVVSGLDALANQLTPGLTYWLRDLESLRRDRMLLADQIPDRYGSFLEARIQWSVPFQLPPEPLHRIFFTVSVPPGWDPGKYVELILAEAQKDGMEVGYTLSSGVTNASPWDTPFADLLTRVTTAHFPGVPVAAVPTTNGMTSSIWFRKKGIPTYGYPVVPMNIMDSARRHAPNERLFLLDYLDAVALYRDLLEEFALVG